MVISCWRHWIGYRWVASLALLAVVLLGTERGATAEDVKSRGESPPEKSSAKVAATPKLSATQKKVQKAILGRWKLEDSEDELEFRPDGVFVGKSHAVEMTTKYEITPDGKLSLDFALPVARKVPTPGTAGTPAAAPTPHTTKIVREVRFEGKVLVLRDPQTGQTFRYRRLP